MHVESEKLLWHCMILAVVKSMSVWKFLTRTLTELCEGFVLHVHAPSGKKKCLPRKAIYKQWSMVHPSHVYHALLGTKLQFIPLGDFTNMGLLEPVPIEHLHVNIYQYMYMHLCYST